jgi:hypothetical protein
MMWQSAIGVALVALGFSGSCRGAESQKAVVIHAGQLIDGKSDRLLSNQVIVIQGDRITEARPAGGVNCSTSAPRISAVRSSTAPTSPASRLSSRRSASPIMGCARRS